MTNNKSLRTEALAHPPEDTLRDAIFAFWLREVGDMDRGAAAQRLKYVLAIGYDDEGGVAATCSAVPARIASLGGQTLLVYRSLLGAGADSVDNWMAMVTKAWETVEAGRSKGHYAECKGLLVPVADAAVHAARPEAEWQENGLIHVGFGQRGIPLRVRYFEDARLDLGGAA